MACSWLIPTIFMLDVVATDPLLSYQNCTGEASQRFTYAALCFLISGSFARHSRKAWLFFFPLFSLSLRIIPEWWVQSLMLSAWIILPTWQHQQIWGEVGVINGLCNLGLRDGAWKIIDVLYSFLRKQSDDLSWWVLCPLFPATCKVMSFAELKQNPSSVFLLSLHHCHNILQFQGSVNWLNISPCPPYTTCTLESVRHFQLLPLSVRLSHGIFWKPFSLLSWQLNPLAAIPAITHSAWCSSPSSVAGVRCCTTCRPKTTCSVATLNNGVMLVTVLCSTIHHRPTIIKW